MHALNYRLSANATLRTALYHYQQRQGYFPPGITVAQGHAEKTASELQRLGCTGISLEESGGCLAHEVWLWLPEEPS